MGVILELEDGSSFSMEIDFLDTIVEIKKKIEGMTGIEASSQILSIEDMPLDDDGEPGFIFHNSRIQLRIRDSIVPEPPTTAQLLLKLPNSVTLFSLLVNLDESVLKLKHRLCDTQQLPKDRLGLYLNGNELQNDKPLNEYAVSDGCMIDVFIKPPLPQSSSSSSKKLMIWVLTTCKTKLCLEVNPTDKVRVLRDELSKLQKTIKFELSAEGYFFIHKQDVLDDRKSFIWNDVRQGDQIELFRGYITYGN